MRRASLLLGLCFALAGCAGVLGSPPVPDPLPFPGISGQLGRYGVDVASWTSGDDGCDDPTLSATAIRFVASGLDEPRRLGAAARRRRCLRRRVGR